MKICPKCNTEFEDNLEFCENDGTLLATSNTAEESASEDFSGNLSENPTEAETVELTRNDIAPTVKAVNEADVKTILSNENAESEELAFQKDAHSEETIETVKAEEKADELPIATKTVAASNRGGAISASTKALIVLLVIAALGGGLLFWKSRIGAARGAVASFDRITKEEMELLLKDGNPMMLKRLADDPEMKKQQIDNLKQMLAIASAAKKEGLANKENVKDELENIRTELTAVNYDRQINKDKGQMPPFSFITEDRVKEFWGENESNGFLDKIGVGPKYRREGEFKKFLDTKIALAKEAGQIKEDYVLKEEETQQAKDYFAKTRIYAEEAKEKSKELGEEFNRKLELMIKLQQAQYLSRLYAKDKLVEKTKVSDAEIDKYLKENPELAPSAEKKAKAEEVLRRAKAGEDFAALAKEFSEDPGSKDKGGLYENVPLGQMTPEFEKAALALEPGQIAENLVETPFGYHIIKLEKKDNTTNPQTNQPTQTYNVRHILFSTMVKDPENPMGREVPAREFVRSKLEEEKGQKVLDELMANNPVEVAEDFEIPKVSDEQLQQLMQQQMLQQQQANPQDPDMPTTEEAPQTKETKEAKKPQPKKK